MNFKKLKKNLNFKKPLSFDFLKTHKIVLTSKTKVENLNRKFLNFLSLLFLFQNIYHQISQSSCQQLDVGN